MEVGVYETFLKLNCAGIKISQELVQHYWMLKHLQQNGQHCVPPVAFCHTHYNAELRLGYHMVC